MKKLFRLSLLIIFIFSIFNTFKSEAKMLQLNIWYSFQLATFKTEERARRFLEKLPPHLKKDAFIYITDTGFYTVRLWPSPSVKDLLKKKKILLGYGIKDVSIVKTSIEKLPFTVERPTKCSRIEITREEKEELLELLYTIFVGNGKLEEALKVAEKSTKIFPEDAEWWERLAQVAKWTGKNEVAFKALYKLVFDFGKWEQAKELYTLSIALSRFTTAVKVAEQALKRGIKLVSYTELLSLLPYTDNPDEYISRLEKYLKDSPGALREIAKIYWFRGNLKKAEETLKLLKSTSGFTPQDYLLMARILFAERKYEESLKILKEGIKVVKEEDSEYLKTLSDLAWALGDYETSVKVSEKLINSNNARRVDYERQILFYYYRRPDIAMKFSARGYKKFGTNNFLLYYLGFAAKLKRWKELVRTVDSLPQEERELLLRRTDILSIYAFALTKLGMKDKAEKLLSSFLRERPDKNILSQYIYLLIEEEKTRKLKYVIRKYHEYEDRIPEAFLSAYLFLQDGQNALRVLEKMKISPDNYSLLLTKADALELYGREGEAKKLRYKIFKKLKNLMENKEKHPEIVEAYLRTAIYFESTPDFEREFQRLRKFLPESIAKEIYYSYLLSKNQKERVIYTARRLKERLRPWMMLNLALWENDLYLLKKLTDSLSDVLPTRDRITALESLKSFGKAMKLAYKGLEKNREDNRLYRQFRDIVTAYKSRYFLRLTYEKRGNPYFLSTHQNLLYHLDDNFYIGVEFSRWQLTNSGSTFSKSSLNTNWLKISGKKLFSNASAEFGLSLFKGSKYSSGGPFLDLRGNWLSGINWNLLSFLFRTDRCYRNSYTIT